MTDSRVDTLGRANADTLLEEQKNYQKVATSLDDAVARLGTIVETNAESLAGKWVEPLRKTATEIQGKLRKAATRYHDVADGILRYQPAVVEAKKEVAGAEADDTEARKALDSANGMPDTPPEEADRKAAARTKAESAVSEAKARLTNALNALDTAGKTFGDSVNCKRYGDGLTDKINWRLARILKLLSKIFGAIALAFAVFAMLIPGFGLILGAIGFIAGAAAFAIDLSLYLSGQGPLLSVILGAIGLGFGGLGFAFGKLGSHVAKWVKNARISSSSTFIRKFFGPKAEINWIEMAKFGSRPPTGLGPGKPNWFSAIGFGGKGDVPKALWQSFLRSGWWRHTAGTDTWQNLTWLAHIPTLSAKANALKTVWASWGVLNFSFNLIGGIAFAGMQMPDEHEFIEKLEQQLKDALGDNYIG